MKDTVTSERFDLLEPGSVLLNFKEEFDDLGQDVYHPAETGGRSRRLAQHYATFDPTTGDASVTRLKTQLFLQGETNKLTGHIARPIEPTRSSTDMTPYIKWGFQQIQERFPLDELEQEWLVNTHLIRTHALETKEGVPVPEGIHQDGVDFLIMGAVSRDNVKGGVSTVHRADDGPAIFETTLTPGQAILIDDSQLFHMASSVVPENGGTGYRDMILMGFHFWSRDHYRYDWKDNVYVAE